MVFQKKYSIFGIDASDTNSVYGLLIQDIIPFSRVLEIGCYDGDTGSILFNEKKCTIVGVDFDSLALEMADGKGVYDTLINVDLNGPFLDKLDLQKRSFDYILLCDVLEHLINPYVTLESLKIFLKKNGKIIVSVPNISYGSIKLSLFLDKFEYTQNGLLDYTHLRFFTLDSLLNLLLETGLMLEKFERIFGNFVNQENMAVFISIPPVVVRYVEKQVESFAYQYYAVCSVTDEKTETVMGNNQETSKVSAAFLNRLKDNFSTTFWGRLRRIILNC